MLFVVRTSSRRCPWKSRCLVILSKLSARRLEAFQAESWLLRLLYFYSLIVYLYVMDILCSAPKLLPIVSVPQREV